MAEIRDQKLPHALVIPNTFQGHINPTIHLSLKLASKGFIVTFVNTQFIHSQITKAQLTSSGPNNDDIFSKARESGLDIRYVTISDGFPLDFDRSLSSLQFWEGFANNFSGHVDELVGKSVKDNRVDPINCLVADTFFSWPSIIAKKYEIVHVSFFSEPALVFALYYHSDLLTQNGHTLTVQNRKDPVDYIPGVKSIEASDLPFLFQNPMVDQSIYNAFQDVRKTDIIIANTIEELELETVTTIQENLNFYSIGPIVSANFTELTIPSSLWSEIDCTQWLDTKPRVSVLYVSFGSIALVNKGDILELAHGLMLSEVNFIWILKLGQDEKSILPLEYKEKVKDRGLIVPWCNQKRVISHSAIGGFLSHCGWNSVVESIWCGVPLICYPLVTDQLANRKLVVYDWKVGINLRDGELIKREEVHDKIKYLMNRETSSSLRKNTAQVKETFHNALAMNGSSNVNFNKLVEELKMKTSLA
ncbi:UDP-glycosyltransferase 86A1-like [Lycium barbarum]|uniref:UDP-glycosyltransferase 86A1-like n=1 Tax=Lycium barbarum TaxID=112863 RepID=UPI00293E6841|nr:UDP-glycosyltransferase 86A1-like [Lycium barbarum]